MRWRWAAVVAVVLALGIGVVALAGDDEPDTDAGVGAGAPEAPEEGPDEAQRQRGPFAVGTRVVTFIDEDRPTAAAGPNPERPSRELVTELWYPAAGPPEAPDAPEAEAADGPFPLVLFSHGQNGEPAQYASVLRQWARAGYVVAAPHHPLTIRGAAGGPYTGDYVNQPADLSFVADAMAEDMDDLVDVDHLAAVGHSSGSITALGMAYHSCCRDERLDAVVFESSLEVSFEGTYDYAEGPAALFFHGDVDVTFPLDAGRSLYAKAPAPKAFVTLSGGSHSDPYRTDPLRSPVVAEATIAWLDRHVKDRPDAEPLATVVGRHPVAAVEEGAG